MPASVSVPGRNSDETDSIDRTKIAGSTACEPDSLPIGKDRKSLRQRAPLLDDRAVVVGVPLQAEDIDE